MCGVQSARKRAFADYGWPSNNIRKTSLGKALERVLNLSSSNFVFTNNDDLALQFSALELSDGPILNIDYERVVIGITNEQNKYLKLFYRIRDGLAHGRFRLRLSSTREKMVVIQDNDRHNVTARIVIKLDTLLQFISTIDINGIIG